MSIDERRPLHFARYSQHLSLAWCCMGRGYHYASSPRQHYSAVCDCTQYSRICGLGRVRVVIQLVVCQKANPFFSFRRTKKKDIYVISTLKRPVPLEHHLYAGKDLFKIVGANEKKLNGTA